MYKIGIIGDRETVSGFMALGYVVHVADDKQTASAILKKLIKECDESGDTVSNAGVENGYAIIFITEKLAGLLSGELEKYAERRLPSVTVLPDKSADGGLSIGMKLLKRHVETAVGADILFRE